MRRRKEDDREEGTGGGRGEKEPEVSKVDKEDADAFVNKIKQFRQESGSVTPAALLNGQGT